MNFDWKAFEREKVALHCATKEEVVDFLNECEKYGYRVLESMKKGGKYFREYGKATCFSYEEIPGISCAPKSYYLGMGYEVAKWQKQEVQPKTIADVLEDIEDGEIYQAVGDRYIKCENGKITVGTETQSVTFLQNEYFRKVKEVDFATAIEYMKQGGRATCLVNERAYKIADGQLKSAMTGIETQLTLKQIESKWLIEE